MKCRITSFEDLVVWQKAQELAAKIYLLADTNRCIVRDFTLRNQLKSAAISISDNIAEGFEYNNNADFHRFLRIAKGSCGEIRNKILFLQRMGYVDEVTSIDLIEATKALGRQIGRLIITVKEKIHLSKQRPSPPITHNP